ncbi:MAG: hypothetical protein H8D38_01650 [DPANN group archaeon]|nr:hypothetical protein [DPANN group archaeon]
MFISKTLKFYKREDVQEAILNIAENKEIAVKYGERGFGRRPDVLQYKNDVLEHAKRGATSFHCSEENWHNPLQIDKDLRASDLNKLRKGWDLVLDIDCPNWKFSKLTAFLFVKALKTHNITTISAKFSGNKGFHIAVPFESFPKRVGGKETKDLFPEAPRKIAHYLLSYIGNFIKVEEKTGAIYFDKYKISKSKLEELFPNKKKELIKTICKRCKTEVNPNDDFMINFVCAFCSNSITISKPKDHHICPKCNKLMERIVNKESQCKCNSKKVNPKKDYISRFNPLAIIEVDTILISSRHLFRMPYSFHETSKLVSVPINPHEILTFQKSQAEPEQLKITSSFLDRSNVVIGEAANLLTRAFDFEETAIFGQTKPKPMKEYDELTEAIPEQFFPPCVHTIFKGLEDGRKRSLFILTNFLSKLGWNHDEIEEKLNEWNQNNREAMREVYIKGHLRYHKVQKKKIPPPNCPHASKGHNYYSDIGVCQPDSLCRKIKNPIQYSKIKAKGFSKQTTKKPKNETKKRNLS